MDHTEGAATVHIPDGEGELIIVVPPGATQAEKAALFQYRRGLAYRKLYVELAKRYEELMTVIGGADMTHDEAVEQLKRWEKEDWQTP